MIYKKFQDLALSALGMGCMRLPMTEEHTIDERATAEMVAYAMEHGVNYYDTAYGYHGGQSEIVMGRILSAYPRKRFYLATKFPGYDLSNIPKVEEIFETQLAKTGMTYFDFYLFHNVCEMNIDAYLDPKYGILDYLKKQKRAGRIRHLGFSAHGSYDVMKRFLDAYGEDMEFCQIQLNWLDWTFQNAKEKVELLRRYSIPVWVMEPLRGGKLASLSEADTSVLRALRPQESTAAMAFRFIQSVPEVVVTLSGMSDFRQLRENVQTFETDAPLDGAERQALADIAKDIIGHRILPCTGCRYCVDHCPSGLDIPRLIRLYNEHAFTGGGFIAPMALQAIPSDKQPSACLGCRSCEAVCPQQLRISEAMADFTSRLQK